MPISDQQRILPNYAFTQANKSQIIAYAPGSSSITLVSKIDIEHEYLDAKFGHIHDIATNRIKLLLVFSTKGQVLVYETSKGCQLMKTASLNCHSFKFLKETLT